MDPGVYGSLPQRGEALLSICPIPDRRPWRPNREEREAEDAEQSLFGHGGRGEGRWPVNGRRAGIRVGLRITPWDHGVLKPQACSGTVRGISESGGGLFMVPLGLGERCQSGRAGYNAFLLRYTREETEEFMSICGTTSRMGLLVQRPNMLSFPLSVPRNLLRVPVS